VADLRRDPTAGRPLKGVPSLPAVSRRPSPRPAPARVAPSRPGPKILPLVLWPALLTLAVTLLRLVGELRGWSPFWFSRLPGGGLSPLGIAWLAPLVGFYFGWRLERAGVPAPPPARAYGVPAAALAVGFLVATLAERLLQPAWTTNFALWAVAAIAVGAATFRSWPALGRPLLAYAYAARVPVALVAAFAIWKSWGTHYDVPPPGFPAMPQLRRWFWLGLLPQATLWVAWTLSTGAVLGALGWLAASRLRRR
jgi:hypothetical protein